MNRHIKRVRRHRKIRTRTSGTKARPRLSVFKSNKYLYAQLVDDEKGEPFLGVSSAKVSGKTMSERARELGKLIAKKATEKRVKAVSFDRGGFSYAGNIKAFADGAREGGLTF